MIAVCTRAEKLISMKNIMERMGNLICVRD